MATVGYGEANVPIFCHVGYRDFFKIDETKLGGGVGANLQKSRELGQKKFIYAHNDYYLSHAPGIEYHA